jgi:hypothetical protein
MGRAVAASLPCWLAWPIWIFSLLARNRVHSPGVGLELTIFMSFYYRAMHLTQVIQVVVFRLCLSIRARCWSFAIGSQTMWPV